MANKISFEMSDTKAKFIGISLPIPFYNRIKTVAEANGQSLSRLLRRALIDYVEKF